MCGLKAHDRQACIPALFLDWGLIRLQGAFLAFALDPLHFAATQELSERKDTNYMLEE